MTLNIFFIQPFFSNPTLPNFKGKFEMLSLKCEGVIVSPADDEYKAEAFGEFKYYSLPRIKNRLFKHIRYLIFTVRLALKYNKQKKFDYIYSYDPIALGFTGSVIKWLTGVPLVTEINGHLKKDAFLNQGGLLSKIKYNLFMLCIKTSIKNSIILKFLNDEQKEEWAEHIKEQKCYVFPNFAPTHVFQKENKDDEGYILSIGFPFYRKGMDVLIKAFLKIADEFPKQQLRIYGHCPDQQEKQKYIDMTEGNNQITINNPVSYSEVIDLFQKCTFFVLASRSEAMGRVVLEAMAAEKAVVGTNVGGIPTLIADEENGLLFENENVDDLADKMKKLLSDNSFKKQIEERAAEYVDAKFSSEKYTKRFLSMLEGV